MRLREVHATYRPVAGAPVDRPQILDGLRAAALLGPFFDGALVERFGVLTLDTKHRVIGWDVIGLGTLDSCVVHARDVFRVAILQNAAAVILAHNHPSGDPSPSPDDLALTRRLIAGGELMGITVLDHVILGELGRYVSLKATGGMNA
jgi:DNA repair protein RadC